MGTSYTQRLTVALEAQGARVRQTKKGIMVSTDKGSAAIHNTPSDYRHLQNATADLRRIGLTHPDTVERPKPKQRVYSGELYPSFVTEKCSSDFLTKARQELWAKGWPPEVTTTDFATGKTTGTRQKILYNLGYRLHPEGKKRGRYSIWVPPEDLERAHHALTESKKQAEVDESVVEAIEAIEAIEDIPDKTQAVTVAPAAPASPNVEVQTMIGGREFIDSEDSWTVETIPKNMVIGDYIRILREAGLTVEIRVWHEKGN